MDEGIEVVLVSRFVRLVGVEVYIVGVFVIRFWVFFLGVEDFV